MTGFTGHRLRRCRDLWGACRLVEAPPAARVLEDVLLVPPGGPVPAGLFAAGRRLRGEGGEAAPGALPAGEPAPDGLYLFVPALAPHYGHFVTDTLAHLWPLAAWEGPRPRLALLAPPHGLDGADYARVILERLGLGPGDLVHFDRPVRLPRLLLPEPAFEERAFVHAVYGALCREIGRPFRDGPALDRPVYLTKTRLPAGIARIANEEAIVEELDRRGVEIVAPETLPFVEQVRLVSTRRVVMGSTGSAFHTTIFAAPGRRVLGLNWTWKLHANFALLDAVTGTAGRYYFPLGTRYGAADSFHFGWQVRDPRAVAAELLARAEAFDRLDAIDAADDAADRTLLGRVRGLVEDLRWRLSRGGRGVAGGP
ncbi:glycosyltransferase family 61 protein [Methylobacterium sp. WSM2598]|uniref:glycosyltransferase family 61 protein n=1 Tax=Methylobacterium sp. WSM2598 TaxID=398261 RepID=UPI0003630D52|nr:glycosyltransferase family 61 protein [Methylobacterium sp. WSM2598]